MKNGQEHTNGYEQGTSWSNGVTLDADYCPTEDEPFMNPRMRAYFRRRLLDWKQN